MSDKLILTNNGRKIFEKKIRNNKGLEEALDDLRRKML